MPGQTLTSYPVSFNGLSTITTGPDGNLWFGGNNHIGRITTAGVFTSFNIPTGNAVVNSIVAGPDGALWFTEQELNSGVYFSKIGRITTAGVVTEFPLSNDMAFPEAITGGPDGNLWFAEGGASIVGKITTSGVITEYPVPNGGGYIYGIVAAPDGAIWLTNGDTNQITRVATDGSNTQYSLPHNPSYTAGMAVGPDGALWFAEFRGVIGRITTAGTITEFPVPNASSEPWGVATGPDGAIWFTELGANQIGRITTDGTVTEYPASGLGFLNLMTAGPDGAMWFTVVGGKIGRITTSATVTPPTISATPPSISVTQVVNGPSITQNITLTSSGTTQANVTGITAPGTAGDSVIPGTGPTPLTFPVVLTPGSLAVGPHTDTITVTSNAANNPLQIPVTLNIVGSITIPTNDYYFADLVFNGGFQTTLTYINYSPQTVTCITRFYSDGGVPVVVPFGQAGALSVRTDVLAPGQSFHDAAPGVAGASLNVTTQGWAHASCNGPIQASLLYRYYTSATTISGELAVSPETAPASKFVTFAQTATGVAYANPSSATTATATVKAFSSAGAPLGTGTLTILPLTHGSFNVAPFLNIGSFTGWLQITSTSPIITTSINAEAFPSLSSMPPGDLPESAGSGAGAATDYYFSDLVFNGGFQTTLTYINYSTVSVTCTTTFYSDSGSALLVPFNQAGMVSTRTDVLPPGQSFHDPAPGVPANGLSFPSSQGWAHASCTGPIQASLLYRYYSSPTVISGELAVLPETVGATKFVTFAQSATGVAYANPGASSATVTVSAVSSTGTKLGSKSLTIAPLQHGSFNVAPFLNLSSFSGWLVMTSTNPVISLSINAEAFPSLSSMPPGDLPGSTTLVVQ